MFRLLRYFSLTSLVSIAAVAVALGMLYRETAERSLVAMGESNNRALTVVLANALWPQLERYLRTADGLSTAQLAAHPERAPTFPTLSSLTPPGDSSPRARAFRRR